MPNPMGWRLRLWNMKILVPSEITRVLKPPSKFAVKLDWHFFLQFTFSTQRGLAPLA
jgi:hypothetical protein